MVGTIHTSVLFHRPAKDLTRIGMLETDVYVYAPSRHREARLIPHGPEIISSTAFLSRLFWEVQFISILMYEMTHAAATIRCVSIQNGCTCPFFCPGLAVQTDTPVIVSKSLSEHRNLACPDFHECFPECLLLD